MFEDHIPKAEFKSIYDIEPAFLHERNIKGIIIDMDNTLVAVNLKEPDDRTIKWVEYMKENGFDIFILSNAYRRRVERVNRKLDLTAMHSASKPRVRSFMKAAESMGLKPAETAVVGDQLFTDIRGGNRAGMFTILVDPIFRNEFFLLRFRRYFETLILRRLRATGRL